MAIESSNELTFSGTYRHSMDAKHRVTIPSTWRRGEDAQFYLMPSPDGSHVSALPPSEFQKVHETLLANTQITPAERRQFARHYFSQAQHCIVDRQGRLLLPDEFCRVAGLQGELVLIGTYDRVEIWNPERWEGARSTETATFQQVAMMIGI